MPQCVTLNQSDGLKRCIPSPLLSFLSAFNQLHLLKLTVLEVWRGIWAKNELQE